jgi:hypothetical protein
VYLGCFSKKPQKARLLKIVGISLMLDSTGPDGSKTQGFFPNLVNILGKNSVDADNDSTRYSSFLQSGSLIASDFKAEYFKL